MDNIDEELQKTLNGLPWAKPMLNEFFQRKAESEPVRTLAPEQARLLAAVQVELSVEVCEVRLTLEQLLDISPGEIFVQELPEDGQLSLRLCGSKIATGRFVRKDGVLAIEILSVAAPENGNNLTTASE